MNNVSCSVIKDLLPIYVDDIVSDDTRQLVSNHLQECTMCRRKYEDMCTKVVIPIDKDTQPIKRIKQAWNRKKVALVCFTLIAALIIMVCGIFAIEEFVYKEQIAYNSNVYELEKNVISTLPDGCQEIGYLAGIAFWSTASPTADFMGTNLDGKYGGCPIYQDPDNTSVIYLEDFSGFYLPFRCYGATEE